MKYMLLIHQGDTPTPGTEEWERLSEDERKAVYGAYQSINQNPGRARDAVFYLYPDDLPAYHAMIRRNGVDVPELDLTFYGHQEFRLDDPDGNRLWIGKPR